MKVIYTRKKESIIVDDDDYVKLLKFNWYIDSRGYAATVKSRKVDPKQRIFRMHRYILGLTYGSKKDKLIVDHINKNRVDNQKKNLRLCTRAENKVNTKLINNKTGYKGVSRQGKWNSWRASITINYKIKNLGSFDNPEDAARAYNKEAKRLYGKLTYLNLI